MRTNELKSDGFSVIQSDYESLRTYAMTLMPPHPIGLDLWYKKGFVSWSMTLLHKSESVPAISITGNAGNQTVAATHDTLISDELAISLSNILTEWSDTNGKDEQGAFNPQSLPLYTPVNHAAGV